MAISDRITSIEEHIKESYQELEGIGIDTTGVNKNLENIPKLIDGYWETLPKVTGEGTSITLDNTKEGKMKINLKGNTYQDSTTGKNLFDISKVISSDNGNVINNGNGTLSVKWYGASGKAPSYLKAYCPTLQVGDEVILTFDTTSTNKFIYLSGTNTSWISGTTRTITQQDLNSSVLWYGVSGSQEVFTISNIMVRLSSITDDTYEPYTNGASPNPDYPQDIHVVSGDNTINVCGKNLANINNISNSSVITIENDTIKLSNNSSSSGYVSSGIQLKNLCPTLKEGDIVYLFFDSTSSSSLKDRLNVSGDWFTNTSKTITQAMLNAYVIMFGGYNETAVISNFMITKVNDSSYQPYKSASYPINLGDIELCKIGDYQDKIDKSSGKNLFDKNNPTIPNADMSYGQIISKNDTNCWFFEVDTNKTYTLTKQSYNYGYIGYSNTKPVIGTNLSNRNSIANETTITINPTDKYLCIFISKSDNLNVIQLEEGTATPYEPYGNGDWYLNKQIGSKDFTTSDFSNMLTSYSNLDYVGFRKPTDSANKGNSNDIPVFYTKGTYTKITAFNNLENLGRVTSSGGYNLFYLGVAKGTTDVEGQAIIEGSKIYYPLATPTYTEITDSTLLSQLNALAKSYASQTNISQENNDMPSILNATALEEME